MRRPTRPPATWARKSATASVTELTMLAPIASQQSMSRCATTMPPSGEPGRLSTRASRSTGPPPRATRPGTTAHARASTSPLAAMSARAARSGSGTSHSWTWPIMTERDTSARKPPPARTILAALDAAATTDGSSITIGTR
jgi:hypothetical protein